MGTIRDDHQNEVTRNEDSGDDSRPGPDAGAPWGATGPPDFSGDFELLNADSLAADDGAGSFDGPLSDLTDAASDGFEFEAAESASRGSEEGSSTDMGGARVSEETARRLIEMIEKVLARAEAFSEASTPEGSHGIVLKTIPAAEQTADTVLKDIARNEAVLPARNDRPLKSDARLDLSTRDVDRFAGGIFRRGQPAGDTANDQEPGGVLPRVIVSVQLAEPRAIVAEERRETSKEMAAMLRTIAEAAVEKGFWRYENQRRAADYRLR